MDVNASLALKLFVFMLEGAYWVQKRPCISPRVDLHMAQQKPAFFQVP